MSRPRLLDLYCGQGGAGMGYHLAGFDVVGVDIAARPRYPFTFHRADALDYLAAHGHEYDAIHASPPCWRYTHGNAAHDVTHHPDLIAPTRDALQRTGLPWVIENVPRAPLHNPLTLCGTMFNLVAIDDDGTLLHLQRHRLFESNVLLMAPGAHHHPRGAQWAGVYGGARHDKHEARNVRRGGYVPTPALQRELMGIDWMTQKGLHLAIPPAYTAHIGEQLIRVPHHHPGTHQPRTT